MNVKKISLSLFVAVSFAVTGCRQTKTEIPTNFNAAQTPVVRVSPTKTPVPKYPDLQAEILDGKNTVTNAPIGKFDFGNFDYPLPSGWKDKDGNEATLENGTREMTEEKIGLSIVTIKYQDLTGDDEPEAIVVLKIETGGSAIPQLVYIFDWQNNEPHLIWSFRTGDRADGGLKTLYAENGDLIIELYGQDRYIFGAVETMKIVGDKEDLCCPTDFTRTHYKWNGRTFQMQGKRETFSTKDKNAPPIENLNDVKQEENRKR